MRLCMERAFFLRRCRVKNDNDLLCVYGVCVPLIAIVGRVCACVCVFGGNSEQKHHFFAVIIHKLNSQKQKIDRKHNKSTRRQKTRTVLRPNVIARQ